MNKASNIFSIILSVVLLGIVVYAILFSYGFGSSTPVAVQNNSSQYYIASQTHNATYHQNGKITVTETIDVRFNALKHGIVHSLPEISRVVLNNSDGTHKIDQNVRLEYSDIKCLSGHNLRVERADNFSSLYLGSEYSYANSQETYVFSYTITPDARYASYDIYYFNVLGFMTDTSVNQFTANITFEKPILDTNSQIFVGKPTSQTQIIGVWNAEKTVLNLSANNLKFGEGVTVLVNLPDGYATAPISLTQDIIVLVLILLMAALAVLLFKKKSNKTIITPVVQFTAKPEFTSADVGYIIDKKVNTEDIASLIIYWANKGFINIIEEGKKTYISCTNKKFEGKLYEKQLFFSIFDATKCDQKINVKTLGTHITEAVREAKSQIPQENADIFSTSSSLARGAIALLVGLVFTVVLMLVNYRNVNDILLWCGLGVGVVSTVAMFLLIQTADKKHTLTNRKNTLKYFACGVCLIGAFVFSIISFNTFADPLGTTFFALALVAVGGVLVTKFNVRTDKGCKELGDVLGLKRFIEVAEKSRLEMLVKETPSAFYDVLPYAYVLGVYDKWCKKFESIDVGKPEFYYGDNIDIFDVMIISHILSHTTNSFLTSVTNANLANIAESIGKNVGGFSGGGGFAGGGLGGGGTSSW